MKAQDEVLEAHRCWVFVRTESYRSRNSRLARALHEHRAWTRLLDAWAELDAQERRRLTGLTPGDRYQAGLAALAAKCGYRWHGGTEPDGTDPAQDAAVRLREELSEIFEDSCCASWLAGLEGCLWRGMLSGDPHPLGLSEEVSPAQWAQLRELSEHCDGWWYWPVTPGAPRGGGGVPFGPVWIRREGWERMCAAKGGQGT